MLSKLVSLIGAPFAAYYELTIAEPCKEVTKQARGKIKEQQAMRAAAPHFSFREHLKRQRQMVSPEIGGKLEVQSVRRHYIKDTHSETESVSWLH